MGKAYIQYSPPKINKKYAETQLFTKCDNNLEYRASKSF